MDITIKDVKVKGRGLDKTFWITFETKDVRQQTLIVNAKDVVSNYLAAYPTDCPVCHGKRQPLHRCVSCQSIWQADV